MSSSSSKVVLVGVSVVVVVGSAVLVVVEVEGCWCLLNVHFEVVDVPLGVLDVDGEWDG